MTDTPMFGIEYRRRKRETDDQLAAKRLLQWEAVQAMHPDAFVFDDSPLVTAIERLKAMAT